ncbi:hypothetical protein [Nocardia farcinica]|uniref:hypothetical protein n=1 Tax=Nocardia farcinica TaxID=37329 RepID=UPI001893923E|nr:hypothetical protein [Nocardia farcinica]MBF6232892.1 hypothetical protein [Nocardia farcinica]
MLLPAKSLRLCVATAAAALALTAGLAGCSDDESSDTAATSTSAAATSAAATSSAGGDHDHAAPTAEELQGTLTLFADPAKTTADKTAVVVDGDKRAANIDTMNQVLGGYGPLTFAISDIKTEGESATAQVVITSPHGVAPAMPLTWQHEDDKWKISDASACTLLAFAQAPCTP